MSRSKTRGMSFWNVRRTSSKKSACAGRAQATAAMPDRTQTRNIAAPSLFECKHNAALALPHLLQPHLHWPIPAGGTLAAAIASRQQSRFAAST
jgi:hypothetical protein